MRKTILFAAGAAVSCLVLWTTRRARCDRQADATALGQMVDGTGEDSFPASDPPSYTGAHVK